MTADEQSRAVDTTGHGITDAFVERVAYEAMRDKRDALLAENQRLRDALQRIASNQSMTETPGVLDRSYSGIQAQAMKQWAREALAGDAE